jgi:hypothetical protein
MWSGECRRHAMPPVSDAPKISVTHSPSSVPSFSAVSAGSGAPDENTRASRGSSPAASTVKLRRWTGTLTSTSADHRRATAATVSACSGVSRTKLAAAASGTSTLNSSPYR